MAIYTKTGDQGMTSLASGERVAKTDARIEAYGTVDELNSWLGLLRANLRSAGIRSPKTEVCIQTVDMQLLWVQNKLFNLGAALSDAPGEWIAEADVVQLEQWIDDMQKIVAKQHCFLLPAGSETVCQCHVCRTICRRAERKIIVVEAEKNYLQFANRLSDYLFVLSRYIAHLYKEPEIGWKKDFCVEKLTE